MLDKQLSYIVFEVAAFITISLVSFGFVRWSKVFSIRFFSIVGLLLFLFVLIDLFALKLNLWSFPLEGSLSIRILGLPIEEYILLLLHMAGCIMLMEIFQND